MVVERYTGTCEIKNDNSKNLLLSKEAYVQVLEQENERLHSIIEDIKNQLDYLETYSSKEDVFEDMKRRLDRINNIVNGGDTIEEVRRKDNSED